MNTEKIICFQEWAQQNRRFMENTNLQFANSSSSHQYLWMNQQYPDLQEFKLTHFHQSPATSYYTTEFFKGFAPYDSLAFHPYHQSSNVQSFSVDQSESCKISFSDFPGKNQINDPPRSFTVSFEGKQDLREFCRTNSYPATHLSFSSNLQQKQSPRVLSGSRRRIRWTKDLHDKFVECVNHLGGAEKATPKAILKLMDSERLTIFQVKSHLQKYRIGKYLPDTAEGKSEKKASPEELSELDTKTGMQIKEALQLQLDVQRHLHEQLEIQRNLQLRIEEQGRQLKMMLDQQQKTKESLEKAQKIKHAMSHSNYSSTFTFEDAEGLIRESSGNSWLQS